MKEKTKTLSRQAVGVVLIVFGLLSVFIVINPTGLLATLIYPQYFWYHQYPSSTDSANPTIITAGTSITLDVEAVYTDATAGINLPNPAYWIVTLKITNIATGTVVNTINFGLVSTTFTATVGSDICAVAVWQQPWTVPTGDGVTYKFSWSLDLKDSAGVDYGTQTSTTYGATPLAQPDGTFSVNGKVASQTSGLVVLSPSLTLSFVPTKNPDKISGVTVDVLKGSTKQTTVTLAKQSDSTYSAGYTLPSYGTYTLNGYIAWSGGNPLQKMSLVATWGSNGNLTGNPIGINQIIGVISMAAGAFLVVWKRK